MLKCVLRFCYIHVAGGFGCLHLCGVGDICVPGALGVVMCAVVGIDICVAGASAANICVALVTFVLLGALGTVICVALLVTVVSLGALDV